MRAFILAVTGVAIGVSACGSYSTSAVEIQKPAGVASVSVTLASPSLIAGQTQRATVVLKDANGAPLADRTVEWRSSAATVATVDDSGVISGIAPGAATVSAVSEGVTGDASLNVIPPPPVSVSTVLVALNPAAVVVGQTAHASATLLDGNGNTLTGRTVSWQSGNTNVATVSSTGDIVAVAAGTAAITASSEGKSGSASFSVSAPAPVPVASISVSPTTANLQTGATVQLSAVTRDANNNVLTGRVISWSSSNSAIASVSGAGLVTAVAAGSASITASSEGKTASSAVTVTAVAPVPVASVSVSPATASVPAGQTVQLSATTRDANNNVLTGRAISWTSSNSGVATVSGSGLVTAVATGSAQITATSENQSGSASISVTAPPPPPPSGSVEPAGMTPITENSFTTATEDGWYFEYGQTNAQIVQDPSAPRSPSGVLQLTYPAGMTGGTGPNSLERDWASGTYKTLYVSSWMKLSSNFYGHCGPDVTKTLHIWVSDGTTSGNRLYTNVRGCGSGPLSAWVNLQGVVAGGNVDNGTSAEFGPNLGQPATIVRGQWQHYELVIKANSAGTADGTIDWWLDGVHVGSYGGIQYVPGNATWDLMKWNPTWGGLGGVVPADFTESMDHIYVSGKR